MDELRDLYRCRDQIERELKQVSQFRTPYPKRSRREPDLRKNTKFERALLRLKSSWDQILDAIFRADLDNGVFDKIAHDVMKTFHGFYSNYKFDNDQLSYAFRCVVMPVTGQLLQEHELGRKAYERQERRKYFLLKLLDCGIQEVISTQIREETPSLDESLDICSEEPPNVAHIGGGNSESSSNQRHVSVTVKPTDVTIIVLDILVEAIMKFTKKLTETNSSGRHLIYHVMNIQQVIDTLMTYINGLKPYVDGNNLSWSADKLNLSILVESFERYQTRLWKATDLFDLRSPHKMYKSNLEILLSDITSLKASMKKG